MQTWDLLPDGRVQCWSHVDGKVRMHVLHRIDHKQQMAAGAKFYRCEADAKAAPSQGLIPAAGVLKPPFSEEGAASEVPGAGSGDSAGSGSANEGTQGSKPPTLSVGPIKKS